MSAVLLALLALSLPRVEEDALCITCFCESRCEALYGPATAEESSTDVLWCLNSGHYVVDVNGVHTCFFEKPNADFDFCFSDCMTGDPFKV